MTKKPLLTLVVTCYLLLERGRTLLVMVKPQVEDRQERAVYQ